MTGSIVITSNQHPHPVAKARQSGQALRPHGESFTAGRGQQIPDPCIVEDYYTLLRDPRRLYATRWSSKTREHDVQARTTFEPFEPIWVEFGRVHLEEPLMFSLLIAGNALTASAPITWGGNSVFMWMYIFGCTCSNTRT